MAFFASQAFAETSAVQKLNSEAKKLDSYPLFDWLRIFLATLVALGHEGMPAFGPIDGNLAVVVFLALSGWLIGGILLSTSIQELPRFFFNRATRIWLPYAFTVVMIFGLAALRDGIDLNWFKYLFYDVTFTHITFTHFPQAQYELPLGGTGNHFWSISVEEQFYLVAPFLMLLLPSGKKLWVWALIAVALLAFQSIFAAIALGVLAAMIGRDFPEWYAPRSAKLLVWAAAIATFALCWVHDTPASRAVFAVFLVQGIAIPAPRGQIGTFVGAISYPFYLNHWMGAFLVNGILKYIPPIPHVLVILASYVAALVMGVITWALVDRWVMRTRNSWYTHRRGIILGALAYGLVVVGLIGGSIIHLRGG